MVVIKITMCCLRWKVHLRSELGDSLGALTDGVLGQLTGENKPDGSLDLSGSYCGLLVVASQRGGLICNLFKDVIDEGVQDGHRLGTDSCVWVDLHCQIWSATLSCMLQPVPVLKCNKNTRITHHRKSDPVQDNDINSALFRSSRLLQEGFTCFKTL